VRFRKNVDSHDWPGNALGYLDYDNSS
jgi:hypothetical protein